MAEDIGVASARTPPATASKAVAVVAMAMAEQVYYPIDTVLELDASPGPASLSSQALRGKIPTLQRTVS